MDQRERDPPLRTQRRTLVKNLSLQNADYELFERKTPGMSDALSLPVDGVRQFDHGLHTRSLTLLVACLGVL